VEIKMVREFCLPDLGEGIHEGEVLAVHVRPGQPVNEGDILLEVETDKAAVEIPSPVSGKVVEVRVKAGELVHVGDVLVTFEAAGGVDAEKTLAPPKVPTPAAAVTPALPLLTATQPSMAAAAPTTPSSGPVPASPATRRLARELDVDLRRVKGSGPAGLVTAEDVRQAAAAQSGSQALEAARPGGAPEDEPQKRGTPRPLSHHTPILPDFARWGPVEKIPLRSLRRTTAQHLSLSWSQIPHVNSQDTADVTRLEQVRAKFKDRVKDAGGRLTMTVFALKAAAAVLKRHPRFNASLDAAAGEIILKHYVNIGVAVNTTEGLMVPVVRDVDRKSLIELAIELHALVARTRNRKVALEDMQGGSFTITNAGAMGGGFFAPLIHFPEVAILGMGMARWQPAVVTDAKGIMAIEPRRLLPLVVSIDHRVLDGVDAVAFLAAMRRMLEDPDEFVFG
jgi:pyruvate dehydrogenase E2 component (dihydrolipoamide acetyltransferase)